MLRGSGRGWVLAGDVDRYRQIPHDDHMADFRHLNVMSALGDLSEGVRRNGTAPDLVRQIDALRNFVYELDSTSAARQIREVTVQAQTLAGPANQNGSPADKLIRQSAYRLEDIATVLEAR